MRTRIKSWLIALLIIGMPIVGIVGLFQGWGLAPHKTVAEMQVGEKAYADPILLRPDKDGGGLAISRNSVVFETPNPAFAEMKIERDTKGFWLTVTAQDTVQQPRHRIYPR